MGQGEATVQVELKEGFLKTMKRENNICENIRKNGKREVILRAPKIALNLKKKEEEPTLKKTNGKFLITFD